MIPDLFDNLFDSLEAHIKVGGEIEFPVNHEASMNDGWIVTADADSCQFDIVEFGDGAILERSWDCDVIL